MKTAWIDRNINLSLADIKDGNLKSILGLFYSLSRYQQQQKAKLRQGQEHPQAKAQPGEATPDNHHLQQGRNTPQLNGGEMLSRFAFMIFLFVFVFRLNFFKQLTCLKCMFQNLSNISLSYFSPPCTCIFGFSTFDTLHVI